MTVADVHLRGIECIDRDEIRRRGYRDVCQKDEPVHISWRSIADEDEVVSVLREHLGDEPVALFKKSADPSTKDASSVTFITLNEFLDERGFKDCDDGFVRRVVTNIKNYPALIDALLGEAAGEVFDYAHRSHFVNLWINYRGQFGRAHFDELENFNLQLTGRKRFVLAPPGRDGYYLRPLLKGFGHHSDFPDLLNVDLQRFPKFRERIGTLLESSIGPGEMLYIPIGWWHQVEPTGDLNTNMNFWLRDAKLYRRPYVFMDSVYKALFRRVKGRYNYHPISKGAK